MKIHELIDMLPADVHIVVKQPVYNDDPAVICDTRNGSGDVPFGIFYKEIDNIIPIDNNVLEINTVE